MFKILYIYNLFTKNIKVSTPVPLNTAQYRRKVIGPATPSQQSPSPSPPPTQRSYRSVMTAYSTFYSSTQM